MGHLLRLIVLSLALLLSGCDEEFFRQYWLTHFPNLPLPAQLALPAGDSMVDASARRLDDRCESLQATTPRGLSCLHCMHPNAQEQVGVLLDVLQQSCLKSPAISYLVDGSFGFSKDRLRSQILELTSGGRTPLIQLYLTNGASQRRWDSTPVKSFATTIAPKDFRDDIINDKELRGRIRRQLLTLLPIIEEGSMAGAQFVLVPMLEDNLTRESFEAFVDLIEDTLPRELPFSIGRNPCPGCYSGNDSFVPQGVMTEVHTVRYPKSLRDGIVSNDGRDYRRSADEPGVTNLEELARLRDASDANNSIFILWSGKRQGMLYSEGSPRYPAPDERKYLIPDKAEQKELVSFLRGLE